MQRTSETYERQVRVEAGSVALPGNLSILSDARGIVLFAHSSGSSRFSPRNRYLARALNQARLATLLLDLLTGAEEELDARTGQIRFDIPLLTKRVVRATDWIMKQPETRNLPVGYFGANTGAAAALLGAAERPRVVRTVVSRGGRPDLASAAFSRIGAPTLLIVGGQDSVALELNRDAFAQLRGDHQLVVIPGAAQLFEERHALEQVTQLARGWFERHLASDQARAA